MMLKHFLAVTATALTMAGSALAAPVSFSLDAFVTSNFNASSGTAETQYVDPINPAGTLTLSYDTDDAFLGFDSALIFFDGFSLNPTAFDLTLTLGGVSQTWSQSEFLIAQAEADAETATVLQSVDFILLTTGPSASVADPNIIGITPVFGLEPSDFLRFDAAGTVTGIDLELQTLSPTPVPLPGSLPLVATGAFVLVALRRRNKKA